MSLISVNDIRHKMIGRKVKLTSYVLFLATILIGITVNGVRRYWLRPGPSGIDGEKDKDCKTRRRVVLDKG